MEPVLRYQTIEQARNAAIKWLEMRGAVFGPHYQVAIGRLGALTGQEAGVMSTQKPFWRLRLDFDPAKGSHYNAEIGEGPRREKAAFAFPGDAELMARLALRRKPRDA